MAVKTKVIIVIVALLVVGGGAAAYFYFSSDAGENLLPDIIEEKTIVYPYTGLKAEDEEATKKRPLCVKIPNDIKARPQTNINAADVVYETMVEGGETRLNAIFQSNVPEDVGPVRSARLSDIWIVPQYNGMLFFSGANSQVRGEISSHDISDMRWSFAESIYFRADNGRGDLHNLHIELNKAYEVAEKRGYEISADLKPLHFEGVDYDDLKEEDSYDSSEGSGDEASADSKLASVEDGVASGTSINVKIAGNSRIDFEWDEDQGRYLKWMNEVEHMDTVEDKQVNVVNVVVIWAEYVQQAKVDAAGSPTYDTVLGGKGDATVFKDGKRYDCKWEADETTPPRFYDSSGQEVFLNQGNTWILVPPTNGEMTSE